MPFKRIKNIGSGSFGKIYKVKDSDNNIYALKEISLLNKRYKENHGTLTELNILYYNTNDYILKYYDAYIENYNLCIITDYYEKGDLQRAIKSKRNINKYFTEEEIWLIFLDLCCGINYIHSHNIIHRDLKTANIFLTNNNRAIIGDFGISKILGKIDKTSTKIGTPLYFSPELINKKNYDKKIDIWGLGCILYEIITLKQPFQNSKSYTGLYNKIVSGDYQKIKNINNYSNELINTVSYLLEVDPQQRVSISQLLSLDYIQKKLTKYNYDYNETNQDIVNITNIRIPSNIISWQKVLKKYKKQSKKTDCKLEPINNKQTDLESKDNQQKQQKQSKKTDCKLEPINNKQTEEKSVVLFKEIFNIPREDYDNKNINAKRLDIHQIINKVNNVKKTLKSLYDLNNKNKKYKIHCMPNHIYAQNYVSPYRPNYKNI